MLLHGSPARGPSRHVGPYKLWAVHGGSKSNLWSGGQDENIQGGAGRPRCRKTRHYMCTIVFFTPWRFYDLVLRNGIVTFVSITFHASFSAAVWRMNADEKLLWDITGSSPEPGNSYSLINDNDYNSGFRTTKAIFPWIQVPQVLQYHCCKNTIKSYKNIHFKIDLKSKQLVKGLFMLGGKFSL